MKRIIITFKKKWPQYLLETLVIMIGIIGAHTLNDWSATQNRKQDEIEILGEIKSNLELDLIDLQENRHGHAVGISVLDTLRELEKYKLTEEQIAMLMHNGFRDYVYTPQRSAIETLTTKGVDLISDDSLRISIIRLYDFYSTTLVKVEESYQPSLFTADFRYLQNKYYRRMDVGGHSSIVEPAFKGYGWLQNQDVTIRIDRTIMQRRWLVKAYDLNIGLVKKTIAKIEEKVKEL